MLNIQISVLLFQAPFFPQIIQSRNFTEVRGTHPCSCHWAAGLTLIKESVLRSRQGMQPGLALPCLSVLCCSLSLAMPPCVRPVIHQTSMSGIMEGGTLQGFMHQVVLGKGTHPVCCLTWWAPRCSLTPCTNQGLDRGPLRLPLFFMVALDM